MPERYDVDPRGYGPVSRRRPDILAAFWWDEDANPEIDRAIAYLRPDELVLTGRNAWFKGAWGIITVTHRRVLMTSTRKDGYAYELPVDTLLGVWTGGEEDGFQIAQLHDFEAYSKLFFQSRMSLDIVADRVYQCTRRLLEDTRDGTLDTAHDGGVLDEFERFRKLKDAFDGGALDDDAFRYSLFRIFSGVQGTPPPGTV